MHEMDVAVVSLFHFSISKGTAPPAHEKVELWTVPLDTDQQLTWLRDGVLLPHQLC